jgi:putative transposase
LTLEKPKSLSVALCMAQALCPKEAWLAARGLAQYAWPMFGRPETLVVDGGKEFKGDAFARGCKEYGIAIRPRHRGNVHQGGVVERLLGALNGVIGALPGRTGRSVADRDSYPSEAKARLTFGDLERCVALAVLDHNLRQNEKTLIAPMSEWTARAAELPRRGDNVLQVLIAFLPGGERRLTPQGVSFEALDYYAPWLGELVPERDRLGMLEVRADPRDLSHIYVRHPHTGLFQPAPRRDGRMEPITLWEHKRNRAARRASAGRPPEMKVALRRAISEIAAAAQRPAKVRPAGSATKSVLRAAARSAHATSADKPYRAMAPDAPAALEHPPREKRALPVEEW